jgi:hypothetical protein
VSEYWDQLCSASQYVLMHANIYEKVLLPGRLYWQICHVLTCSHCSILLFSWKLIRCSKRGLFFF